jgi:hypothetical protein
MAAARPLTITPPPGVILTESKRAAEGRWLNSDGVRWVRGRPQKNGGNIVAVSTPASGQPRIAHAWRDNQADNFIATGTYRKLYIYDSSFAQNDVTPIRTSGTAGSNPFTTTSGSPSVQFALTAHGAQAGDTLIISGASAVATVTMNGTWIVATIVDSNNLTFVAGSNANASTTGGGASVAYQFEISVGTENPAFGLGYGVGGYGLGTYGSAHSSSTIVIEPRVWSLDHFGKFLVATYNGGTVYQFDPTQAQPWPRAVKVDASAPTDCRALFVTPERFVFALRESMVVAWCTQGDFTVWTPASSNTANTRTLTEGTKLVGGRVLGPFVSMVWSDAAAYLFQYSGNQYVYNSSLAGKDCGLIGPNAVVTINGVAFWMGTDNFFMYDGSVRPIPQVEDIRRAVYDALDQNYAYSCTATYIPKFNEIRFCYTVSGQQNPTKTVVYSIDQQCWWPLNEGRHAGTHFTQGNTSPYIPFTDGFIYQHEQGYDNNGVAISWSMELAPTELEESGTNMLVDGVRFDWLALTGTVSATVNAYDEIDQGTIDTETETMTRGGMVDFRIAGRFLSLLLAGNGLGQYFRFGKPTAYVRPMGTRRAN